MQVDCDCTLVGVFTNDTSGWAIPLLSVLLAPGVKLLPAEGEVTSLHRGGRSSGQLMYTCL